MNRTFIKYLPVNPRAMDWGIYCTDAGCNSVAPGVAYPPHAHAHPTRYRTNVTRRRVLSEYQLVYITRGQGMLKYAPDCSASIGGGDLFVIFPGVWHGYAPLPDVGWDEYWVGFNGPYARLLERRRFVSPKSPVHRIGLREDVLNAFLDVFDAAEAQHPGFQLRLGAMIMGIVATVLGVGYQNLQSTGSEQVIERAKFCMEENLYGELDVPKLIDELSLSYSSFLKLFKDYTGLSPYQYFLEMKISRAKSLLQEGDVSVKQVAYTLGFDNQYYFSRLFHKKTGLSPTDWKQRSAGATLDPAHPRGTGSNPENGIR